jgi:tetratricopeptide (TPR) repeat protein
MMADIREAAHFYRQGNFRLAETQCGAILSRDERNFDALFLLAAIKLRQNALAEARELFQRLAGFHPNVVAAAANLAFVLSKLGESAAAVAEADRALKLSPGHAGAWVTRGDALAQLDRADEALESYDRALAIDAGNLEALIGRGGLLPRMNRPGDAIATLDRIPAWNNPELLANRANLKRTLGLLASAAADFRRLSEFDGYRVSAWIGLVSCASESCDWDARRFLCCNSAPTRHSNSKALVRSLRGRRCRRRSLRVPKSGRRSFALHIYRRISGSIRSRI